MLNYLNYNHLFVYVPPSAVKNTLSANAVATNTVSANAINKNREFSK